MRRMICFTLLGLLVSSEAAFSQAPSFANATARQAARLHRRSGVHASQFRWHPGIQPRYHYFGHTYFDPFRYFVQDFTTSYRTNDSIVPFSPTYYFYSNQTTRPPQLIFKDGTIYTVSDYWRVDDQLHFVTSEEGGTKSVPRTVPFADLDVQRTTAAAEAQGFRFVLRDKPIEQWLQHRAEQKSSAPKRRARQRQ